MFSAISKFFYNNKVKIISRKFIISSSAINQLHLKIHQVKLTIFQEEKVIFKKNPTVGLLEVSKLIDSAISKRQGD